MLYSHKELKNKYKDNYTIQKLVKESKLFKIEKGLYSDKENVNYLEIITKKYPSAIFTMESAFYYWIVNSCLYKLNVDKAMMFMIA